MIYEKDNNKMDNIRSHSLSILVSNEAGALARVVGMFSARGYNIDSLTVAQVETDENWIELDYGDWDGAHLNTISKETWIEWKSNPSFKPPNGESLKTLGHRVRLFLENVQKNSKQHLLIVTHVSPIKAAVAWTLGVNDSVSWRTRLDTASFTQIQIDSNTPVLLKFNQTTV